jgi:hypothetical protein
MKHPGTVGLAALLAVLVPLGGCRSKSKEEILQAAEDKARLETEKKSRAVQGVGEGLQTAGKEGAQALSKGVGEVFKGTARGFDQSLAAVQVKAGSGLEAAGLAVPRASRQRGGAPTITAYVISEQPFAGTLRLRALEAGREVGRSQVRLTREAGEAAYVDFAFDPRVPLGTVAELELAVVKP